MHLLLSMPGGVELLIIFFVVLILFGTMFRSGLFRRK